MVDRPLYRARTVGLSRIYIRSGANLFERGFAVSLFNKIGERTFCRLRARAAEWRRREEV